MFNLKNIDYLIEHLNVWNYLVWQVMSAFAKCPLVSFLILVLKYTKHHLLFKYCDIDYPVKERMGHLPNNHLL